MKRIYICSPLRGDYEGNIAKAKGYSRKVALSGDLPITPHIYFTQFMSDTVPDEREQAMRYGTDLLFLCDELWAFGIDHPSEGMADEIKIAKAAGIPVLDGFAEINRKELERLDAVPIMPGSPELDDDEPAEIGEVVIHVPAFEPMLRSNEHLRRPSFDITIAGGVILRLAEKLIADPGITVTVGPGGDIDA